MRAKEGKRDSLVIEPALRNHIRFAQIAEYFPRGIGAGRGHDAAAKDAATEFWALVQTRPGCPLPEDASGWRNHWRLLYPWGSEESFEKLLDGIARAGMPV